MLPWIGSIHGQGGTAPAPAFDLAMRLLQPPPDAIFFMTDGQFGPQVVDQVALLNQRVPRIAIHTILFVHDNPSRGTAAGRMPRTTQALVRDISSRQAQALTDLRQIQAAGAQLQRIALGSGGTFRAVVAPPSRR
jgi:hypothetical protein